MKIILIGASGTLGKGIDKELCERHEIVRVGHSSGDFQVDISDSDSIRALFEKTGRFDALVAAVGKVHFGALEEMGEAQYQLGLRDKLMGQVNLVLLGREYANDGAPSPSPAACSPSSRSASAVRRAWSTAPSRASSAAQP